MRRIDLRCAGARNSAEGAPVTETPPPSRAYGAPVGTMAVMAVFSRAAGGARSAIGAKLASVMVALWQA